MAFWVNDFPVWTFSWTDLFCASHQAAFFSLHGSKGVYWTEGVGVFGSSSLLLEGHCAQWRKSVVAFVCQEDTCELIRINRLAVLTSGAVLCACPT